MWQSNLEEMTVDDKYINKRARRFTHQIMCVSKIKCYKEKILGRRKKDVSL